MKRVRLFCLLSLLIFLSAVYTLLTFFPHYVDVNYYKGAIEESITELIGIPVSLGHIDLSFHNGLSIDVDNIRLAGTMGRSGLFIEKSNVLFKLLPLVKQNRFVVKRIRLFAPEIKLERDKGGRIQFRDDVPKERVDSEGSKESLVYRLFSAVVIADIDILEGRLHFIDKASSEKPHSIELGALSFHSRLNRSKSRVMLKGRFRISSGGSPGQARVSGKISIPSTGEISPRFTGDFTASSLAIKLFKPYLSHFPPLFDPEASLDITSSVETDFFENIRVKGRLKADRAFSTHPSRSAQATKPAVSLEFDIRKGGDFLDVRTLRLSGEGYSLSGKGNVKGIFDSAPLLNIHIRSSKMDILTLSEQIPQNLLGEDIDRFLKESMLGGSVRLSGAHYSGKLSALLKPLDVETLKKMSLEVELKNSSVLLPALPARVENINAKVHLRKGSLFLTGATLTYKNCDFKDMKISVKDILSSRRFSASLNGDIDLSQVKHLAENLLAPSQLNKIESPSGRASLSLKISGSREDASSLNFEGKLDVEEAGFTHRGVHLDSLYGTLFFSENQLEIDKVEWEMDGGHFGINGSVTEIKTANPSFDLLLEASMAPEGSELLGTISPDLDPGRGTGYLAASIKSFEKGILIAGDLDLTALRYQYKGFPKKESGVNNKISFSGKYKEPLFYLEKGRFELGDSHIDVSGIFPFAEKSSAKIQITSDHIEPEDLALFLHNTTGGAGGNISLDVTVDGKTPFRYQENLSARAKIRDASFYTGKKSLPIEHINGDFIFSGNRLAAREFTLKFDGGKIRGKGFIEGFPKPDIRVDLKVERLNLNTIFPPKKRGAKRRRAQNGTVKKRSFGEYSGKIEVGDGLYRKIKFNTGKMFLSVNERGVFARPFSVKGFNGNFTGAWGFLKVPEKSFSIEGNFQGIDMEALEKTMKIGLSALKGTGAAKISLSGSGESAREFKETLNGEVSLKIQKGRLRKFLILSKIFSLLNFKVLNMSSKGMSYESISADVVIKNGVIKTDNFLLDSNSFRITGTGGIDLAKSRIDMILGVQPFQTLDKVISHIPVIGKVLTGKKKALIVSYYSVKGSLGNPDIDARPVESLGKGVLGILKRVITLPRDLVTGGDD